MAAKTPLEIANVVILALILFCIRSTWPKFATKTHSDDDLC